MACSAKMTSIGPKSRAIFDTIQTAHLHDADLLHDNAYESGSVLAQMAFPLHASEISDKSETGREKHVSVPIESSHFFPFKKFCTGGAKM